MEPQSPAPAPTPESTPTPNPEATPAQPVTPTPQPSAPQPSNPQPPKKLGTGAIIGIIGGVILLIGLVIGITVAVNAALTNDDSTANKSTDTSKTTDTESDTEKSGPITATKAIDLRATCIGGSVTNAAAMSKPYNYALFDNNNVYKESKEVREKNSIPFEEGHQWYFFGVGSSDPASPIDTRSEPSVFNTAICIDRLDDTAVKTSTCELLNSDYDYKGSTVADFLSVKYKVTAYEAQSGKKISELGTINGPATECPAGKYFYVEEPRIYGDPDEAELNAVLEKFDKQ